MATHQTVARGAMATGAGGITTPWGSGTLMTAPGHRVARSPLGCRGRLLRASLLFGGMRGGTVLQRAFDSRPRTSCPPPAYVAGPTPAHRSRAHARRCAALHIAAMSTALQLQLHPQFHDPLRRNLEERRGPHR